MAADLIISNVTVVDGTGALAYSGDVVIDEGRIRAIAPAGEAGNDAREVIDATGLVLTPGFIDIHTHYDAQLLFEPTASPASWHGVTTVVTGNCGFSLAPSHPRDLEWLLRSLARVEGMQVETLLEGVDFAGGSMASYLARLEGAVGVNVVALAGHCAIRRQVMGDDASERAASSDEITAMCELLDRALAEGAYGFSTAQLDIHADHDGRPVPSNLASSEEIVALCAVLAEHANSVIEIAPRSSLPGYSTEDRELLFDMARVSGAAVNVNMIDWFPGFTEGWRTNLDTAEAAARDGLRLFPMLRANPQDLYFSLADTFIFDDVAAIRDALVMPAHDRLVALRDPDRRDAMRADLARGSRSIDFSWSRVSVAAVHDATLQSAQGRTLENLAAGGAGDALDALLDLALDDDLCTVFRIDRSQGASHVALRRELAQNPLLLAGASDGGAHLQTFCGADYPTRLLTELVPDPLSIELAVHKLSAQPAAMLGLHDRGTIAEGFVADLVLIDPLTLAVAATRFVHDLPAGGTRLVHDAQGYRAVIVGGEVVLRDGVVTGALPGAVLRRVVATHTSTDERTPA
jgi:N-acyl-D-aspartate/D-glutamate deacylase